MAKKLSIISHYYNHPEMVERQIAFWESLPASFLAQCEFILVDDCSEQTPTFPPTSLDLKVYRVISDVPWNQAGARNLGAYNASGEWALFFDIDQKFAPAPMAQLLANLVRLSPNAMHYLKIKELIDITVNQPLQFHPNTFLVNLARFKEIGMYDEDFTGHYGYEDIYLQQAWEKRGGTRVLFNDCDFFEDMGFGTNNLDRDLARNLALAQQKIVQGYPPAVNFLRFEWELQAIPRKTSGAVVDGRFRPRHVHIIDPGLLEAGGHYHTQDTLIKKELEARGIPTTLYSRINADSLEPDVVRLIRYDVFYEQTAANPGFAPFENFFLLNRAFYQDLMQIPADTLSKDDLVYFPGVTQCQLEAISDWLTTLPTAQRPRLAITLRFLNSRMHYNLNRGFAPAIEFMYSCALMRLVERHPSTWLFTDTTVLTNTYRGLSGQPVVTLPIPQHSFDAGYVRQRAADKGPLEILYIGNISPYRGWPFMAEIIETVLREFPNTRFTVQVKAKPDSEEARAMQNIPEQYKDRVSYLLGTLSLDEYTATMQGADIVLLPYMPAYYSFGSSGVFSEAAGLGKVIVVTRGTVMETTSADYALGTVLADDWTAEHYIAALREAVGNFAEHDAKAAASFTRFSGENSPAGFLDAMLSHIH